MTPTLAMPEWINGLPFAASLIVFGMPHGATDGVIGWWWAQGRRRPMIEFAAFLIVYSVIIALSISLLLAAPVAAFAGFLLLSMVHFGVASRRLFPHRDLLSGVLTAGVIVALPFSVKPSATRDVFTRVSDVFNGSPFPVSIAAGFGVLGVLCAAWLTTLCAVRLLNPERHAASETLIHIGVLAAVVASHATLPPLLSVGLWFLIWHAIPETLRIGRARRPSPNPLAAAARGHALSLPFLLPTLAVVFATASADGFTGSLADLGIVAIAAYAAVTPGHVVFQETIGRDQVPIASSPGPARDTPSDRRIRSAVPPLVTETGPRPLDTGLPSSPIRTV